MMSVAPAFLAISAFASVDTVVITRAPAIRAICTISRPAPPEPACTRQVSPDFSLLSGTREVMRGHSLQHGGCGGTEEHPGGNVPQLPGGHHGIFGDRKIAGKE